MQNIPKLTLSLLRDKFGICHLEKNSPFPEWAKDPCILSSIAVTSDEISIICPQDKIPAGVFFDADWRAFKLETVIDLSSVGIVFSISRPLAQAGISIMYICTYQTNYLLVEEKNLKLALEVLSKCFEVKVPE